MHILLGSMIYSYLVTLSIFYIISTQFILSYTIQMLICMIYYSFKLCVCVFFKREVVHVCECRWLARPEESVISPGGGVQSCYEPSAVGAGI